MTGLFVSWTASNGRTADLASELGLTPIFVHRPSKFGLIGRYAKQFWATHKVLRESDPRIVWIMLPPFPLIFSLSRKRSKRLQLIADLHTGFFANPRWSWATRFSLQAIGRRGGLAVVTNTFLQNECTRQGVTAVVLHDIIRNLGTATGAGGFLLCPVSYSRDEPIGEILKAATLMPEIEWRLTGAAPRRVRDAAPANVTFTGFVSDKHFQQLLNSAAGIVAMTTKPHTMQRAGYEALSHGNVQVTSAFADLQDFYEDSAIYTHPAASDIAAAAEQLLARRPELQARTLDLRRRRIAEQTQIVEGLTRLAGNDAS